ncbi:MAG: hypothetical protein ACOX6J_01035 [Oscillospiraceae bacterium]|jgi:hypothetical protein
MIYKALPDKSLKLTRKIQTAEMTEAAVFRKFAKKQQLEKNVNLFNQMADENEQHGEMLRKYSGRAPESDKFIEWLLSTSFSLLGFPFTVQMIFALEKNRQDRYPQLLISVPETGKANEEHLQHRKILDEMQEGRDFRTESLAADRVFLFIAASFSVLAGSTLFYRETRTPLLFFLSASAVLAGASMAASFLTFSENRIKKPGAKVAGLFALFLVSAMLTGIPYMAGAGVIAAPIISFAISAVLLALTSAYISICTCREFWGRFLGGAASLIVLSFLCYGVMELVSVLS